MDEEAIYAAIKRAWGQGILYERFEATPGASVSKSGHLSQNPAETPEEIMHNLMERIARAHHTEQRSGND